MIAERRLGVLADDQEVIPALAAEEGGGRVLDRDRVAEPGLRRPGRRGPGRGVEQGGGAAGCGRGRPGRRPRRRSASRARIGVRSRREVAELLQVRLAAVVGEPDDLEEVVPLGLAVGVVVDGLAGPGEELGGGVRAR